ncbi:hypothetical protein PIB30_098193, partial [Stylosanthes scabra]|nr:hypothetical protein [Stylosanthes scabra]
MDAGTYAYTTMMQTTARHPLIKPRRGPYPYLSTHMRGSPRICVDHQPLPKSSHALTPPTNSRAKSSLYVEA